MAADSGGTTEILHLEPFIHQVGGHSSMLQLDDSTICKPLINQEMNFYDSAPLCLKEFMPEFRGVIEVTFSEDKDGYLCLTSYLPSSYKFSKGRFSSSNSMNDKHESKTKHRIRLCQSGSIKIESSSEDIKQLFEEGSQGKGQNGCNLNPWVLHCHQEQLNKIRKSPSNCVHKYILLENLAYKFQYPCIMDLKMGTRQYGDDASLAKRQSHMAKVASTTSSSLGLRICGMQVYHHESGHFICHNKYYGRGLTVDGFRKALYHFLHDGSKLRSDVVNSLLDKLNRLYNVVQSLDTFRFFTSSLLIIYDGIESSSGKSCDGNLGTVLHEGHVTLQLSDNGNDRDGTSHSESTVTTTNFVQQNSDNEANLPRDKNSVDFPESAMGRFLMNSSPSVVDVRMIDFAHSTHSEMNGLQNTHLGPDEGYLFGIENLINELKVFQKENK